MRGRYDIVFSEVVGNQCVISALVGWLVSLLSDDRGSNDVLINNGVTRNLTIYVQPKFYILKSSIILPYIQPHQHGLLPSYSRASHRHQRLDMSVKPSLPLDKVVNRVALARSLIKHAVLVVLEPRKGLELIPSVTMSAKGQHVSHKPPE